MIDKSELKLECTDFEAYSIRCATEKQALHKITRAVRKIITAQRWCAMVGGQIIPTPTDLQYYEQVREKTFGYKRRTFRDYMDHLETRWCIRDCRTIKALTQN